MISEPTAQVIAERVVRVMRQVVVMAATLGMLGCAGTPSHADQPRDQVTFVWCVADARFAELRRFAVYSGDAMLSERTWGTTPAEGTTIATMDVLPAREAEYRLVAELESAAGDRLFGHSVRFQRTTRVTLRSDVVQTVVVWARSDEHAAEGTLAARVLETAFAIPTCESHRE